MFGGLQAKGRARGASGERVSAVQAAQLQEHCRKLLESPRNADEKRLLRFGYRVYSQSDEDGILHEIFRRIGEGGRTFVEIGAGDGLENNTLFLLVQGWRGVWIEGTPRKVSSAKEKVGVLFPDGRLGIEQHFVNRENIDGILSRSTPGAEIDLLSMDIDGNDWHVLRAIRAVSPRVIVAEYNAKFPPDIRWVMEYNETHRWDGSDYFGASLGALEAMLSEKGYSLAGCNLLGCNAFFVRKDLASEALFRSPFTAVNHYEPARYFLLPAYHAGFPPGFGPFVTSCEDRKV